MWLTLKAVEAALGATEEIGPGGSADCMVFDMIPDLLIGVEFGRLAGKKEVAEASRD